MKEKNRKNQESEQPIAKSFREVRYEEKKMAILRSAAKAFGRKGFNAVTIEEIAAELKLTKGSLYYYFPTKEIILYEVHLLSLNMVVDTIKKINKSKDSADVKLKKAVEKHLEILANEFEGGFLLQQEFLLPGIYRDEVISLRNLYEKNFVQILEEGVRSKIFSIQDVRIVSFCMLGAINWFLRWYSSSGRLTSKEIADAFVDFFMKGIIARKKNE
jgi:AcrR family transcriptional regulator